MIASDMDTGVYFSSGYYSEGDWLFCEINVEAHNRDGESREKTTSRRCVSAQRVPPIMACSSYQQSNLLKRENYDHDDDISVK